MLEKIEALKERLDTIKASIDSDLTELGQPHHVTAEGYQAMRIDTVTRQWAGAVEKSAKVLTTKKADLGKERAKHLALAAWYKDFLGASPLKSRVSAVLWRHDVTRTSWKPVPAGIASLSLPPTPRQPGSTVPLPRGLLAVGITQSPKRPREGRAACTSWQESFGTQRSQG